MASFNSSWAFLKGASASKASRSLWAAISAAS